MLLLRSECQNIDTKRILSLLEKIQTPYIKEYKKKCDTYTNKKYTSTMFCDEISLLYDHETDNKLYHHFKRLESEISNKCTQAQSIQDELNSYYNVEFLEKFLHLLTFFPVWTNVIPSDCKDMRSQMFDVDDRHFSSISNFFLKNAESDRLPLNKFAIQHAQFLKNTLQENREYLNVEKQVTGKVAGESEKDVSMHTYLNLKEDWRGKGDKVSDNHDIGDNSVNSASLANEVPIHNNNISTLSLNTSLFTECADETSTSVAYSNDTSRIFDEHSYFKSAGDESHNLSSVTPQFDHSTAVRKKKSTMYNEPNPEVNVFYSKARTHGPSKTLKIRNGNTMQLKSRTIEIVDEETKKKKKIAIKYVFDSTSGVDSIAVLVIHGIFNFNDFNNDICNLENSSGKLLFLQSVHHLATTEKHATYYADRFRMLLSIGELRGDNIVCPETIDRYFIKLMDDYYSISQYSFCSKCDTTFTNNYSIVPSIFKILKDDIKNKSLSGLFTKASAHSCEICTSEKTVSFNFNGYIAIHVENENWCFELRDIQAAICIGDNTYFLAGLIGYTPAVTKYGQPNYAAYRRTTSKLDKKWKKPDGLQVNNVPETSSIAVALILYIRNKD